MAETLFPVFEIPAIVSSTIKEEKKYKKSLKWDIQKGDFVLDGAHRIVECSGREAYEIWCLKIVHTERYACLAYSNAIGTEMEEAMKQPDHPAVESFIERTINEALMVNPRTEYVREFTFNWDGDAVRVSFIIKGRDYEEFPLSVDLDFE